jgi:hypothetical protein
LGWTRKDLSSYANRTSSGSGHAALGRCSFETWILLKGVRLLHHHGLARTIALSLCTRPRNQA